MRRLLTRAVQNAAFRTATVRERCSAIKSRLLTRRRSGLLRVDVSQCTTSGSLRMCCWRAVPNGVCVREPVQL